MSRRAVLSPPAQTPGARLPEETSHRRLRGLAIAATATTFLLIAIGGLVRATGSGLGCTGWPKCTADRWLPPLEHHAIIEYSHRFTAFLDVVLVVLLALVAWRRYRSVPSVLRPAMAGVVLVLFQAILGGIVVHGDLEALLVTAHLATAMVFVGVLVMATVGSFSIGVPRLKRADATATLARLAAATTLVLVAVGAYVRGQGAGLAFRDWPLMNGRLVPDLALGPAALHFAHRALAASVVVVVGALALRARRQRPRRDPTAVLALLLLGLMAGQVMIGAANVWSRLAPAAVVAHVAVAGLAWGAAVGTSAASMVDWSRSEERSGVGGRP